MKIAILGTRGIPNHYGGFEQFAEYLAAGLVTRGHEVTVYNSHTHSYREAEWNGVRIRHVYDPEHRVGTAGQFVYDFLAILDSRKRGYDVILELGYTSSSVFFGLHPSDALVVTNMDGLEWKRTKYSAKVQKFLRWAESLAVKRSDILVADSLGIRDYLLEEYGAASHYIPYGAHLFEIPDPRALEAFDVNPEAYDMLIARLEPENSIEPILDGAVRSGCRRPFLVIGKHETGYGEYLKARYAAHPEIRFVGAVYDIGVLNNLRWFSHLYFHGHTVGGTNPSLLEAMASGALICANDNPFNAAILGEDALYFKTADDVAAVLERIGKTECREYVANNRIKITELYEWDRIIDAYEALFFRGLEARGAKTPTGNAL